MPTAFTWDGTAASSWKTDHWGRAGVAPVYPGDAGSDPADTVTISPGAGAAFPDHLDDPAALTVTNVIVDASALVGGSYSLPATLTIAGNLTYAMNTATDSLTVNGNVSGANGIANIANGKGAIIVGNGVTISKFTMTNGVGYAGSLALGNSVTVSGTISGPGGTATITVGNSCSLQSVSGFPADGSAFGDDLICNANMTGLGTTTIGERLTMGNGSQIVVASGKNLTVGTAGSTPTFRGAATFASSGAGNVTLKLAGGTIPLPGTFTIQVATGALTITSTTAAVLLALGTIRLTKSATGSYSMTNVTCQLGPLAVTNKTDTGIAFSRQPGYRAIGAGEALSGV